MRVQIQRKESTEYLPGIAGCGVYGVYGFWAGCKGAGEHIHFHTSNHEAYTPNFLSSARPCLNL